MKKYFFLVCAFVLFGAGLYAGYAFFAPSEPKEVRAAHTIVEKLQSEGFLITQSYVFTEQVAIDKAYDGVFKNFFWGQDIRALGTMKVGMGIDLRKLTSDSVAVTGKSVTVTLPPIERYSTELVSELQLTNRQGLLKKIFDNDSGYQVAEKALKEQAEQAAGASMVTKLAEESAKEQIARMVRLITPYAEVAVTFR